jgi:DNA gyrase/topoisomerase IV subunit B
MSKRTTPKITKAKNNFTEISWLTDFERFGMLGIDDESFKMIQKRLYDIAACNLSVKIYLNGELINFKSFSQYAEMYTSNILFEQSPNWKIGIGHSTNGFRAVSFVNSVETKDGGTTWTKIDLGRACNKIRIYKDNKNKVFGYAIGVNVFKL